MIANKTKITLSAKELELVCNTDWILTKHTIINKVVQQFGEMLVMMQEITEQHKPHLPKEIYSKNAKIGKGENYKGLPYVMLDYPRYFEKEETLAIRTLFWWGNFFSTSLQLAGNAKKTAVPNLLTNFLQLQQQGYWLCVSDNPWQHHFEEDNYVSMQRLTHSGFKGLLIKKPFIKIGKKIDLQQWDAMALFIVQTFIEMINLLKTSCPNDEKGL